MKVVLVVLSLAVAAVSSLETKFIELAVAKSVPSPFEAKATGIAFLDEYTKLVSTTPVPTADDVLGSPIFVLIPAAESGKFVQFYAEKGLKSLAGTSDPVLKPVVDFISSASEKTGIVFRPITASDPALLKLSVTEGYIPSNFKVGDLFKTLVVAAKLPYVILAEKATVESLNLKHDPLAKVSVAPGAIEIVKP